VVSTIKFACVDINRAITLNPPPMAASYEPDCASRCLRAMTLFDTPTFHDDPPSD
jgi:hypothetical protein